VQKKTLQFALNKIRYGFKNKNYLRSKIISVWTKNNMYEYLTEIQKNQHKVYEKTNLFF
jgi:hypothetical protein